MNQAKFAPQASRAGTNSSFSGPSNMYMPRMNAPGFYNNGATQFSSVAQGKQFQGHVEEAYYDAAFERAFDAADREIVEQEAAARGQQETVGSQHNSINEQSGSKGGQALKDYEEQLKQLEQQNKRRLSAARREQERAVRLEQQRAASLILADGPTYEQFMERAKARGMTHAEADHQWTLSRYLRHGWPARNLTPVRQAESPLHDEPGSLGTQGNDEQQREESQDDSRAADQADELARTAGQLLDNLKDEKSEKFRQSNFMQLMRQLRDKEVMVEGENIVPVSKTYCPCCINTPGLHADPYAAFHLTLFPYGLSHAHSRPVPSN